MMLIIKSSILGSQNRNFWGGSLPSSQINRLNFSQRNFRVRALGSGSPGISRNFAFRKKLFARGADLSGPPYPEGFLLNGGNLQGNSKQSLGKFSNRLTADSKRSKTSLKASSTNRPAVLRLDGNFMQIGLATSEDIQDWAARSYFVGGKFLEIGEVKKADTINYRTFKPEKDGLFCERIFGPVNDWVCACGISNQKAGLALSSGIGPGSKGFGKGESPSSARGSLRNLVFDPITFRFRPKSGAFHGSGGGLVESKGLDESLKFNLKREKLGAEGVLPTSFSSGSNNQSLGDSPYGNALLRPFSSQESYDGGSWEIPLRGAPRLPQIPRICPQCQVEFTLARIRRYRMGYISLACDVTHIWYLNSRPNLFSVLFRMPTKYVKKITYYKGYTPSDPKLWNPCLGPGGDFFDTEWEFIHMWLGNREVNTLSTGWTANSQSSMTENLGIEATPGTDLKGPEDSFPRLMPRGCTLAVRPQNVFTSANKTGLRGNPSRKKSVPQILPTELGLLPSWLKNTGGAAFQTYARTRNWEKEFRKLQDELRRTPEPWIDKMGSPGGTPQPWYENFRVRNGVPAFSPVVHKERPRSKGSLADFSEVVSRDLKNFGDEFSRNLGLSENLSAFVLKRRKKRIRTLKLLNIFRTAGGAQTFISSGFILNKIPVLPPELRPIVQLSAGQLASSDVNDLYRRVLSRNNRLKYYLTGCGPHPVEFLVRSERHLVQLACDAVFENGKTTNVRHSTGGARGSTGIRTGPPYKSLSDRIGGKQGRFRQNLLGKRVDYSGRSVIVVGPKLKFHECGLPIEMAMELFQAFLIRHIMELQLAKTIRGAKNLLRFNQPLARQLLQNIVESHPILLNRAPTLHRLGIQAFQPKLVSGKAIQLHPLVCPAFNADFDGDQMAVHIPLSPKSRIEARLLMLATTNWLSPATGQPSILPSQDMVLGFYYLTIETPRLSDLQLKAKDENLKPRVQESEQISRPSVQKPNFVSSESFSTNSSDQEFSFSEGVFSSFDDVLQVYQTGNLHLHHAVWVRTDIETALLGGYTNTSSPPHRKKIQALGAKPRFSLSQNTDFQKGANVPYNRIEFELEQTEAFARNTKFPDEPLHLRFSSSGLLSKLYLSFKWIEDTKGSRRFVFLRTTPGRILVNQLIRNFAH